MCRFLHRTTERTVQSKSLKACSKGCKNLYKFPFRQHSSGNRSSERCHDRENQYASLGCRHGRLQSPTQVPFEPLTAGNRVPRAASLHHCTDEVSRRGRTLSRRSQPCTLLPCARIGCYRFLKFCKFNFLKAEEKWTKYVQWRNEYNADDVLRVRGIRWMPR